MADFWENIDSDLYARQMTVVVEAVIHITTQPILAEPREILERGERSICSRYAVIARTVIVFTWANVKDIWALKKQYTFPRMYLRAM